MSSKVIEDRRMQLRDELTRQTNLLELQLKSLPTNTLPGSPKRRRGLLSTGSLGSLNTSSCGSLNSQCLLEDECGDDHYPSYCNLPSNTCSPIYESNGLATKRETTFTTKGNHRPPYLSSSKLSLFDSNPPLSPPMSPLMRDLPRRISEIPDCSDFFPVENGSAHEINKSEDAPYRSYTALPLTSYQSTMGSSNEQYGRTVPNESIAADSGVFEASNALSKLLVTRQDSGHSSGVYCDDDNIETAQVRVGLEYRCIEEKLILNVENGRNIKALCFQPLAHVYLKGSLLPPAGGQIMHIRTGKSTNTDRPSFNEQFLFTIDFDTLLNKTLQIDLLGLLIETNQEESLGCFQISLAEFESAQEMELKWYNFLSPLNNTSHTLNRSNSADSLEAILQRFKTLPGPLAKPEHNYSHHIRRSNSYKSDQGCESRDRLNSNEDSRSMNNNSSQSNITGNSLCGSTERMRQYTPPRLPSAMLHHLRARSGEREERTDGVNVSRSISDCSGYRRSSLQAPFIRMGAGRRSVRQKNKLTEPQTTKPQTSVPSLAYVHQKRDTRPVFQQQSDQHTIQGSTPTSPLDLEIKLQAAYAKQKTLSEEIFRLKEIKQLMGESEDLPQWLVENGESFDALLDEAKREISSHLLRRTSFPESDKKFTKLVKKNSKKENVIGFQDKTRAFTAHRTVLPPKPKIHWV